MRRSLASPRSPLSRRALLQAGGVAALASGCRSPAPEPAPRGVSGPNATRSVTHVIVAQPTVEGAGVHLRRSIGASALPMLDPFLLLDEIHSDRQDDYVRGFPSHPHRGFETVTYMIDGAMEHKDSMGNHGHLGAGAAQWMTAGHGIVHSEMPRQDSGWLWGFQLWVNLPRSDKMTRPRYQDIAPERIAEVGVAGAKVRVVAGTIGSTRGPIEGIAVEPTFLDVSLGAKGRFEHDLPPQHTAFVYVIDGALELGATGTSVGTGGLAVLGAGATVVARAARPDASTRFFLVAGRRLGEPVARRGPFVMSTDDELQQAFDDYRSGRLTDG